MDKNSFTLRPPMGWNSYDYYDTTVNEEQVRANADYMAAHLKEYGWEYVVVDIQWYAYGTGTKRQQYQYIPFSRLEMDEYARLLPDPEKFPSSANGNGFKPLADYIHNLGLKFGIHIMRGIPRVAAHNHSRILGTDITADMIAAPSSICGWNPDMYGLKNEPGAQEYYNSLLKLYEEWGVDYIKCDDICNTNLYANNPYSARHEIEMLHHAIKISGRPIVLSLSPGPALIEQAWHYEKHANMWRITDDFWDSWPLLLNMFERCELWQNHVTKGCYPDCDMLPLGLVGKGFEAERVTNFTREEQITMMTLWCIFRSPLMLGAELTMMDEWTLSLITNKHVLAMLSEEHKAVQVTRNRDYAVWFSRNQETNECYVALFNFRDEKSKVMTSLDECGYYRYKDVNLKEVPARELWTGKEVKIVDGNLTDEIAKHGAALFKLN